MFGAPLSGYPLSSSGGAMARLESDLDVLSALPSIDFLTSYLSTDLTVETLTSTADAKVTRALSTDIDVLSSFVGSLSVKRDLATDIDVLSEFGGINVETPKTVLLVSRILS